MRSRYLLMTHFFAIRNIAIINEIVKFHVEPKIVFSMLSLCFLHCILTPECYHSFGILAKIIKMIGESLWLKTNSSAKYII